MDAAQALAELRELSSQVERAVLIGTDGTLLGSTDPDEQATSRLVRAATDLVAAAGELGASSKDVLRVDVELAEGSLFVVAEGGRTIAATTAPHPTTGLVVYDLRTCLQRVEDAPKRRRRRAAREDGAS